jgi:mRNA-degrading endonuclease RelE of RelBE toxin-antitoxin system
MNFEIVATRLFVRELKWLAKRYPAIRQDVAALVATLRETADIGTPLGKDCFKIRFPITGKSRGKSGGGRLITCVKIQRETVLLLAIYDKSEQENITDADLQNRLDAIDFE